MEQASLKKSRIRKACDSCNIKRTKCNGEQPCSHCSQVKLGCTYLREEKKRGRASEKYPKKIKRRKRKQFSASEQSKDVHPLPAFVNNAVYPANVSYLYRSRREILTPIAADLDTMGVPITIAEELFGYYFADWPFPPSRVFSILRPNMVMTGRRTLSPTLILTVLLAGVLTIDHIFFGDSRRAQVTKTLYQLIQHRLPQDPKHFTYDDMVCTLHIGYFMPWISYPMDALRWWNNTCISMKRLVKTTCSTDEEMKEEERRAWLSVYILDRLTSFTFNKPAVTSDEEFKNLIIPCDEIFWLQSNSKPLPAELDSNRPVWSEYHGFSPGIYGWFLPLARILGLMLDRMRNNGTADALDKINVLLEMNNKHVLVAENYVKGKPVIPGSNMERVQIDVLYAKFSSLSMEFMKHFMVDPAKELGTIISNFDSDIHEDEYRILVRSVEVLEELLKHDSDMRRYPFSFSVFVFGIGYAVFLILNNMEREDAGMSTKKINKLKYLTNVLVRAMEIILVSFPVAFIRTLRNMLLMSLQDCEKLILLTDHFAQFKLNAKQRKESLMAYNWLPDSHGLVP